MNNNSNNRRRAMRATRTRLWMLCGAAFTLVVAGCGDIDEGAQLGQASQAVVPACNYNGICEFFETPQTCVHDCDFGYCGDGFCTGDESVTTCKTDCFCGNSTCDSGEDCSSCEKDCGCCNCCGDGICEGHEFGHCLPDCHCGNFICELYWGENYSNCPNDCRCGNGVCNAGETTTCPQDWGGGGGGGGTPPPPIVAGPQL